MTIELTMEHQLIAEEARERIKALVMRPLAQAADTAELIFETPDAEPIDSEQI